MPTFSLIPAAEASDFADLVRELFEELGTAGEHPAFSGECRPAVDVFESDRHMQVSMDLAGTAPSAVRVAYRDGVLLIVGEKAPPKTDRDYAYHLLEREYGRFARVLRLNGAVDVAQGRASLHNGELSIVLPKIVERRGQLHRVPIADGSNARP